MTSAISFVDDKGGDLGDYKFKTNVPAADKMWCLASCSKARLSLSVAKNTTANPRQTTIDVTAYLNDTEVDTYTITVMQNGESQAPKPVRPSRSSSSQDRSQV